MDEGHEPKGREANPRRPGALPEPVLVCILAAAAFLFLLRAAVAISYRYDLDYGEGIVLDQVARFARLESIYHTRISTAPYVVSNYPPVYQLLQVPLYVVFGPAYWYGRAISTVAVVLVALLVGLTVETVTRERAAALVAGLAVFVVPPVYFWGPLARVDSLALAFAWAGVCVAARSKRSALVPLVALSLVLAVLTKHSYAVTAPAAAVAFYVQRRQLREGLLLAVLFAALTLVAGAVLDFLTNGGFRFHLVTANLGPYAISDAVRWLIAGLSLPAPLFVFAAAFCTWRALRAPASWLPIGVFCGVGYLTAVSAGKAGADVNYLYEAAVGSCAALGLLYASRGHVSRRLTPTGVAILAQVGMLVAAYATIGPTARFAVLADAREVERIIHDADGPVICDVGLGVLPLLRRELYLDPFATKQLADTGHWEDDSLVRETLEGRFAVIIQAQRSDLLRSRWTPATRQAIAHRYRESGRIRIGSGATEPLYASVLRPIPPSEEPQSGPTSPNQTGNPRVRSGRSVPACDRAERHRPRLSRHAP